MHHGALAAAMLSLAATTVSARRPTPDAPPGCTYATCALHRSGDGVLMGVDGPRVGSFGPFSAPRIAVPAGLAGVGVAPAATSTEPWASDHRPLFEEIGIGLAEDLLGSVVGSVIYR